MQPELIICDEPTSALDSVIVDQGDTANVLNRTQHEYTRNLLAAVPRLREPLPILAP